jgi:hypothetical protein
MQKRMKRYHFETQEGRDTFHFTPSGLFTLVDKEGEPLYEKALPFFEKVVSHLLWILLWLALIWASHAVCSVKWLYFTDRILTLLLFFHLFLLGCRLTTLLLKGGLRAILFPPLWVKLTRQLQKGAGLELLQKYDLHNHPGLLANLSLAQYRRGQYRDAHQTLTQALAHAPDDPVLLELFKIQAIPPTL